MTIREANLKDTEHLRIVWDSIVNGTDGKGLGNERFTYTYRAFL